MKMIKNIMMGGAVALCALLSGCSDVEYPVTPTEPTATAINYSINDRSVTLSWELPAGEIEAVRLYADNVLVAELAPEDNTYTINRQKANVEVLYTVKVVYKNGIVSLGKTVGVTIVADPAVPAMLLPGTSVEELVDDDEIAAAQWFAKQYPNGKFLTADDLAAEALDPDKIGVVWVNIDREGLAQGWRKLPKTLSNATTTAAIKDYMAMGGNIFLTKHAVQLVVPYGIVDAVYAPNIFGSGEGGQGDDIWAFNANIGLTYNHTAHEIFKGLTVIKDYGHDTYALEGPGWREDHNCCWDLNAYGLAPEPNTVVSFENATNSIVLGTWAHVTDFAVAAIVEFLGTEDAPGKCLANGLAAYEFNQKDGNPYQSNVDRLTQNCIDYLNK